MDNSLYISFYYITTVIIVLFYCLPLLTRNDLRNYPNINNVLGIIIIAILNIFFIGLRDPYADEKFFGDTIRYTQYYDILFSTDVGFWSLMFLSKSILGLNITGFYLICSILYVLLPLFAFKKWFEKQALFPYILYITSMSFWNFGVNGIRTGLAVAFFIFALANRRIIGKIIFIILSISFHKSLLITAACYFFIISFKIKLKYFYYIWFVCLGLSLIIGREIISFFTSNVKFLLEDDVGASQYVTDLQNSIFRFDFVLYSGVPILFGRYFLSKKTYNNNYINLYKTYILANSIWLLFMYANFTNRFAFLSWFILPMLLIFPLIKNIDSFPKHTSLIFKIVLFNLLFTILLYLRGVL